MAGDDLYQMLGLNKSASQADIKKAYYKLALQWHPDRNPAPEATAKFQALQRVYDVLSDPAKRQTYDRTGSLQDCEDMVHGDNFQELYTAFREALKVTEQDIDNFAATYRGSSDERADLLQLYTQFSGDMPRVFDWLMLSRTDLDSHRFRDAIEAAIAAGEVKRHKAYKPWAAQVAAAPPPSIDPLAPPMTKKKAGKQGDGDDMALVAAIRNKQTAFSGMMAKLEAKYGGSKSNKSNKKQQQQQAAANGSKRRRGAAAAAAAGSSSDWGSEDDGGSELDQRPEPTEEEFEAARARLQQKTGAAAAGGGGSGKQSNKQPTAKAAAAAAGKQHKRRKA